MNLGLSLHMRSAFLVVEPSKVIFLIIKCYT